MIMGDKIIKVEDAFIAVGGYILSILKNRELPVDILYAKFSEIYPKHISFEQFTYAVDFLFMINKIKIKHDDVLEIVL